MTRTQVMKAPQYAEISLKGRRHPALQNEIPLTCSRSEQRIINHHALLPDGWESERSVFEGESGTPPIFIAQTCPSKHSYTWLGAEYFPVHPHSLFIRYRRFVPTLYVFSWETLLSYLFTSIICNVQLPASISQELNRWHSVTVFSKQVIRRVAVGDELQNV